MVAWKYFIFIPTCLFLASVAICIVGVEGSLTGKAYDVTYSALLDVGALWLRAAETVNVRSVRYITEIPDITSPWFYLKLTILVLLTYAFWGVFIRPLNRVKLLGLTGYIAEGEMSVKETANLVQKRRKVGSVPPVYPNGWFGLMEGFLLKKGEAKTVSCLGQNLAVFRDEYGRVHALDAYCPHMGANLAAGGRVFGDCIECPFHAWRFRGEDGKCTQIPYTEKIPDIARVKSWPVRELSGWIFLWHHVDGAEPTWSIPELEGMETGSFTYRGRTEHHVNAHIQEIPENGADVVHLDTIHGPAIGAGVDIKAMWSKWWSFAKHNYEAGWKPCQAPDGHVGLLTLNHTLTFFGFALPGVSFQFDARQIGPGIVYLEFESFFGKGVIVQTVLPLAPMTQKVTHNIYVSKWMPTFLAKLTMLGEALQVERDMTVWNNKQYQGRPLFVKSKEDSLIAQHRRWFTQFYSENSPRIFQKDTLDF